MKGHVNFEKTTKEKRETEVNQNGSKHKLMSGTIISDKSNLVNIREFPSTSSKTISTCWIGTKCEKLSNAPNGFIKVKVARGPTGFILSKLWKEDDLETVTEQILETSDSEYIVKLERSQYVETRSDPVLDRKEE